MQKISLELIGNVPSKKNSRNCFVKYGRLFNIPSERYKEWHNDASFQLKHQVNVWSLGDNPIQKINCIEIKFIAKDRRKFDLTNRAESIMDLLVDCGIIEDDNYSIVPNLYLHFGGIDSEKIGKTFIDIIAD